MFLSVKSLLIMQMLLKTFKEHHHGWWNLGLRLWCRNKSPVFAISLRNITHTQKITASLVQCKSDADCVLWLWRLNSSWISTSWPDREQGILSEGDEKAEWGREDKMNWFVEGEKQLLHHDNAPVHSSLPIHDFVTKHETMLIP
jgi:hypothetical protein